MVLFPSGDKTSLQVARGSAALHHKPFLEGFA